MKKIKKAVIPVAGMGTRFLPITKSVAKEMLPIIDKPALHYIIEECVQSGIEEILLVINPQKKNIIDYFKPNLELEEKLKNDNKIKELETIKNLEKMCKIEYVIQDKPLGSGHAIKLAKNFINNQPFAVLYGDDLMKYEIPVLKQLIDTYEKYDCNVIGVNEVDKALVNRYGIIEFENNDKIKTIVEKPSIENAPSNFAGLGRYIVKPEIFNELENISKGKDNEYSFVDAMLELMKKQDFYACKFKGTYYDIGNKFGYLKANIEFALDRDDLKDEMLEYFEYLKKSHLLQF